MILFKYLLKIERSVIAFDGKTHIYKNHDASLKDDFLKTPQRLSILILWLSNAVFNLLTWYFWTNLIYGLTHFDQPVWLQRGGQKPIILAPSPVWKVSISEHISWSVNVVWENKGHFWGDVFYEVSGEKRIRLIVHIVIFLECCLPLPGLMRI